MTRKRKGSDGSSPEETGAAGERAGARVAAALASVRRSTIVDPARSVMFKRRRVVLGSADTHVAPDDAHELAISRQEIEVAFRGLAPDALDLARAIVHGADGSIVGFLCRLVQDSHVEYSIDRMAESAQGSASHPAARRVYALGRLLAMRPGDLGVAAVRAYWQEHPEQGSAADVLAAVLRDRSGDTVHLVYDERSGRWLGDSIDGKHEWIPCDTILEVVHAAAANHSPAWILAFDLLRSPTHALIYRPWRGVAGEAHQEFCTNGAYEKLVTTANGALTKALETCGRAASAKLEELSPAELDSLRETLARAGINGATFIKSGHAGWRQGGSTDQQAEWHELLRKLFRAHQGDPATYARALLELVRLTIWDGSLPRLDPRIPPLVTCELNGLRGPTGSAEQLDRFQYGVRMVDGAFVDPKEGDTSTDGAELAREGGSGFGAPPGAGRPLSELTDYQRKRHAFVLKHLENVARAVFPASPSR